MSSEDFSYLFGMFNNKDGEPLIGEISSECVLQEVGEGDKGKYFCLVSHPNGDSSRQSHTAEVTLKSGNGGLE